MERLRRVNRLWNWLPAFRAVAETEHLPSASELLGISPSALSRTIKLVEEDIGRPLFDREGRQLRLNANGHAFLGSVRDAMRRVHDGLGEVDGDKLLGRVHISVSGPARLLFAPRLVSELAKQHPNLQADLLQVDEGEEQAALLRGEIDVAFSHLLHQVDEDDHTRVELLGQLKCAVFCGPGHELHARSQPTRAQILESKFVAVHDRARGEGADAWPLGMARKIGVRVNSLELALQLCEGGGFLALLPQLVADSRPHLRRLSLGGLPNQAIYACRREPLSAPAKAEACVKLMRRIVEAAC